MRMHQRRHDSCRTIYYENAVFDRNSHLIEVLFG